MKLAEVVAEIHKLEGTRDKLKIEMETTQAGLQKFGTAVFSAVRHLSEKNTDRIQFELAGCQYEVRNTGDLTRINQLAAADEKTEIEL